MEEIRLGRSRHFKGKEAELLAVNSMLLDGGDKPVVLLAVGILAKLQEAISG